MTHNNPPEGGENTSQVAQFNREISREFADPNVMNALIATTFKKFTPIMVRQAVLEGRIRGFTIKDFFEKNVYAIKYGDGYNLVTSIDFNRKIGMRSGICGVDAPIFTYKGQGKGRVLDSCTRTVHRKLPDGFIGKFTAVVMFNEYYKAGKEYQGHYTPSMWDSKPHTMIAKVAEMHAYRMACPEELSQSYIEEEFDREPRIHQAAEMVEEGGLSMGHMKKNHEESEKGEDIFADREAEETH